MATDGRRRVPKDAGVLDESARAYKPIDQVMADEPVWLISVVTQRLGMLLLEKTPLSFVLPIVRCSRDCIEGPMGAQNIGTHQATVENAAQESGLSRFERDQATEDVEHVDQLRGVLREPTVGLNRLERRRRAPIADDGPGAVAAAGTEPLDKHLLSRDFRFKSADGGTRPKQLDPRLPVVPGLRRVIHRNGHGRAGGNVETVFAFLSTPVLLATPASPQRSRGQSHGSSRLCSTSKTTRKQPPPLDVCRRTQTLPPTAAWFPAGKA